MRFLFIGDIIGSVGIKLISRQLGKIKEDLSIDFTIANAENSSNGRGVSAKSYYELKSCGIDVMTSGNHIWDNKETIDEIDSFDDLVRPANYPPGVPGIGFVELSYNGTKITIVNLLGRVFMPPIDCPFRKFDEIYNEVNGSIILVDIHAEATSEKSAFASYVDGRASTVIGTHTHVQTNDDRVLKNGTLYITDVGMCGALDSIIGVKTEGPIERFLRGVPKRFEVEKRGVMMLNGLFFDIDDNSQKIKEFKKINYLYNV